MWRGFFRPYNLRSSSIPLIRNIHGGRRTTDSGIRCQPHICSALCLPVSESPTLVFLPYLSAIHYFYNR